MPSREETAPQRAGNVFGAAASRRSAGAALVRRPPIAARSQPAGGQRPPSFAGSAREVLRRIRKTFARGAHQKGIGVAVKGVRLPVHKPVVL